MISSTFRNTVRASFVFITLVMSMPAVAQKVCTSNPATIATNINFGSIVWTPNANTTVQECEDMADGLITFTGTVIVNVANNTSITITNDVNIDGDFPISGGPGSLLRVNGGFTLHVTGDLGDADNNGVQYEVTTVDDAIIVDGTLFGKNSNAFTGNGSISGGTLDVKNGSGCGTPCPVSGGFDNCVSDDPFCTENGVLPITLLSFTAEQAAESVILHWETTMEENFDKFIVERSPDGLDFSAIGEVKGAGRNIYEIITSYDFEDQYPLTGFNYYRLKSVDLDLQFDYSKILLAKVDEAKKFWVHPNPVSGPIHYFTNFTPSEEDRVVLYNQLGRPLLDKAAHNYSESLEFDRDLPSGIYILKYYTAGGQFTTRVLVK